MFPVIPSFRLWHRHIALYVTGRLSLAVNASLMSSTYFHSCKIIWKHVLLISCWLSLLQYGLRLLSSYAQSATLIPQGMFQCNDNPVGRTSVRWPYEYLALCMLRPNRLHWFDPPRISLPIYLSYTTCGFLLRSADVRTDIHHPTPCGFLLWCYTFQRRRFTRRDLLIRGTACCLLEWSLYHLTKLNLWLAVQFCLLVHYFTVTMNALMIEVILPASYNTYQNPGSKIMQ